MKKIISVILVTVLILALLASCGSPSSKIVGRWTEVTDDRKLFSYIEFFSDSTYISSDPNYSGHYSIDGNRIKLSGILMEDLAGDFEIKGNTLILDGDEYKREK